MGTTLRGNTCVGLSAWCERVRAGLSRVLVSSVPGCATQIGRLARAGAAEVNIRVLTDIMRSLATMGYPLTAAQAAPLQVGPTLTLP